MRVLAMAAGLAVLLSATAANALTWSVTSGPGSIEAGAILFNDFNGINDTNVGVFAGTPCNCGTPPNGAGFFDLSGATGSLTFTDAVSYAGFLWGSTDPHNIVQVYGGPNGTTLLGSFSGQTNTGYIAVNGNSQSNVYFNLFASETIKSLVFITGHAFEADNFTYKPAETSAVPLPAALPLFASGLVALGWLARRKRKSAAAV